MKLDISEVVDFYKDYWTKEKPNNFRLGQAFCNKFGITNSVLFYETDEKKVKELISRHYTIHAQ